MKRQFKWKRRWLLLPLALGLVLALFLVKVPVLRVSSPDRQLTYYARQGETLRISSFHSLYHVTQTETWTLLEPGRLRLERMYFGCYEAGEYYSTYYMNRYRPFSGAGDYYLEVGDLCQADIRLIVTPTSQFRIQLDNRVYLICQEIRGFSTFTYERIPLYAFLACLPTLNPGWPPTRTPAA